MYQDIYNCIYSGAAWQQIKIGPGCGLAYYSFLSIFCIPDPQRLYASLATNVTMLVGHLI